MKSMHKCDNVECDNLTINPKFCCGKCDGNNKRLLKIKRFLDGKLNDNDVRSSTIRDYVTKKQDGKCSICGIIPFWNSKPIVFIVDHIDGNYENNDPHNIRTICPNCNSQTDTFSGKNNDKVEHIIKRVKSNPKRK